MTLRFRCVLLLLIVLTLCFIWGNSMLPPEASTKVSDTVTEWLGGTPSHEQTDPDLPQWQRHDFIVRKTAHFVEFMLLGIEIIALLYPIHHGMAGLVVLCGLFCPLLDETIQIFSHRTAAVADVWLDILGYTVGCLIALAITHFVLGRKK